MTTVRVSWPADGLIRIRMQTLVYVTRQGRYSYLMVGKTSRFYYFLTLHDGEVRVERHGITSEFMAGLLPHSKCSIKHASQIYLRSTLPKTDQATEVLDAIQFSSPERTNFFSYQPEEREKRERPTRQERSIQKANMVTLEKICESAGMTTSVARGRLRNAGIEKPGARWSWPKNKASEIIAILNPPKLKLKKKKRRPK